MDTQLSITHERDLPTTLLQLLSNTLVLYQTTPYLPVSSLLALGATSKSYKDLIYNTPKVFRYLDLSEVKSAQSAIGSIDHGGEVWRNVQLDENVTEDDFYGGPLRGIFYNLRKQNILQDVQTLILDGLTVPVDLVTEIITNESFNVRILSIRDVEHLNQRKLQQALLYATRPSRPENVPKLQGLYLFGPSELSIRKQRGRLLPAGNGPVNAGVMSSQGAQIGAQWNVKSGDALAEALDSDRWFEQGGEIFPIKRARGIAGWAEVIQACQGIINFDAVLCAGPRHSAVAAPEGAKPTWYQNTEYHIQPETATHALDGCNGCGRAPEGLATLEHSTLHRFPLLAPPTLHSSTIKAAKTPAGGGRGKILMVRCFDCLRGRYCEGCNVWWCEDCYPTTSSHGFQNTIQEWAETPESEHAEKHVKLGVVRSCFECGFNCAICIEKTELMCQVCHGGYCSVHNEGSTLTTCDWCGKTSGRRRRELY